MLHTLDVLAIVVIRYNAFSWNINPLHIPLGSHLSPWGLATLWVFTTVTLQYYLVPLYMRACGGISRVLAVALIIYPLTRASSHTHTDRQTDRHTLNCYQDWWSNTKKTSSAAHSIGLAANSTSCWPKSVEKTRILIVDWFIMWVKHCWI